jgi:chromosome segregation ATPase
MTNILTRKAYSVLETELENFQKHAESLLGLNSSLRQQCDSLLLENADLRSDLKAIKKKCDSLSSAEVSLRQRCNLLLLENADLKAIKEKNEWLLKEYAKLKHPTACEKHCASEKQLGLPFLRTNYAKKN